MSSSKEKKILFVHHGKGIGGAPRSMSLLAKRLQGDGYDVRILFLHNSEAVKLFEGIKFDVLGMPLLYFNHSSRWYTVKDFHLIIFQIISWVLTVLFIAPYWFVKLKPDAIYFNSSVFTDWSFSAKLFRIKNIVHVREAISCGYCGFRQSLIRKIFNYSASKIIFLSRHNYKRLGTTKDKSIIVHNYVDRARRSQKNNTGKEFDYIYVGGSQKIKGIALIEELLNTDFESKYCLLGYYDTEFINRYTGRSNISIVGAVQNPMDYIETARALLFPATTPHFPRPVIESFSCGVIPIVSNLEGMSEIVSDGVDGFVFDAGSLTSLLEVIEKFEYCDVDLLSGNGFDTYKRKFSLVNEDIIVREVRELLN